MNLVDSNGWLEVLAKGANASFFRSILDRVDRLVVPTISITEVYRWMLRERGKHDAFEAVMLMRRGRVVDLDPDLAIESAKIGHLFKLALADSIIYATAQEYAATLWTQDADFERLPGVKYRKK